MAQSDDKDRPAAPAAPETARPEEADLIGAHLRRLFQDAEKEELPDRFRTLLDRLARDEGPLE
ncbi:NepR family anti-sigma factor [Rubrimonas cliftonensis]|uniref:NepR family anti-sigma factor n=1 Tax=Rubrimonas cliftonensis TaxID=89524 RepID=UPI001FE02A3B|nr:NepR family anti-sigma factor [Rubrimonas cliftonensis]